MKYHTLLFVIGMSYLCSHATAAADLTKVDRRIAKQPSFQSKTPTYGLLVIGPKAQTRIWLVLDGKRLFVDRNGNGDLTEKGELVELARTNTDPAPFTPVEISVGDVEYELRCSLYGWFNLKRGDPSPVQPSLYLRGPKRRFGAWGNEQSPLRFASRPEDAPILHVDGPLVMGFEVRHPLGREEGNVYELNAAVGTRGLGKGAFMWLAYNSIPKDVHPVAELVFPSTNPKAPPVKVTAVLNQRC